MEETLYYSIYFVGLLSIFLTALGSFSYVFLVIPYVSYVRCKDREVWEMMGKPALGIGMYEVLSLIGFLWRRDFKYSTKPSVLVISAIMRLIYMKSMLYGLMGLIIIGMVTYIHEGYSSWFSIMVDRSR